MNDFNDIVDTEGPRAEERRACAACTSCSSRPARRRICRPRSSRRPTTEEAKVVEFPLMPPRRWAVAGVAAATVAAIALGGGYLLGHAKDRPVRHTVTRCRCRAGASPAMLRIGKHDKAGNWPMELLVSGLPDAEDSRPTTSCG